MMQNDDLPEEKSAIQPAGGSAAGEPVDLEKVLNDFLDQLEAGESGATRLPVGLDILDQPGAESTAGVRLDLADVLGQTGAQEKLIDLLAGRFKLPRMLAVMLAEAILAKATKKSTRRKPRRRTPAPARPSKKAKAKKTTARKTAKKPAVKKRKTSTTAKKKSTPPRR